MFNNDCENKLPFPPDAADFGSNLTGFTANTRSKRNKTMFVRGWKRK